MDVLTNTVIFGRHVVYAKCFFVVDVFGGPQQ